MSPYDIFVILRYTLFRLRELYSAQSWTTQAEIFTTVQVSQDVQNYRIREWSLLVFGTLDSKRLFKCEPTVLFKGM